MHIVAINQLQEDTEEMARNLAQVLGITAYECRPRVGIPDGGPAIIASFAAKEQAISCADRLRSAGFHTVTIDSDILETDHNRAGNHHQKGIRPRAGCRHRWTDDA